VTEVSSSSDSDSDHELNSSSSSSSSSSKSTMPKDKLPINNSPKRLGGKDDKLSPLMPKRV
jgi:hypothetical protein